VGGVGSIVRDYPKEDLTVAVIGNLEDGGFGAEYIAKRVADSFIPGAFAAGMKESPDLTPNQTANHLQVLKGISEGAKPAELSATHAAKLTDTFRQQLRENLGQLQKFAFLGKEQITPHHFMLDATAAEIFHYKMQLPKRTIYYHFRFDKQGKISWISFEE